MYLSGSKVQRRTGDSMASVHLLDGFCPTVKHQVGIPYRSSLTAQNHHVCGDRALWLTSHHGPPYWRALIRRLSDTDKVRFRSPAYGQKRAVCLFPIQETEPSIYKGFSGAILMFWMVGQKGRNSNSRWLERRSDRTNWCRRYRWTCVQSPPISPARSPPQWDTVDWDQTPVADPENSELAPELQLD
jgi:hypothetical protein